MRQQGRSNRSCWSGFGWIIFCQGKNKISFYKKVINRSARVIFSLARLVTVNRKAVSRVEKLPATHAHDLFKCSQVFYCGKLCYKQC